MILTLAAALTLAAPDGRRLHEDHACYTLYRQQGDQKTPMGVTTQSLVKEIRAGRPVWRIVVHQRVGGGRFDMRDEFLLDGETLRPLTLVNTRKGETHVTLSYTPARITGEMRDAGGAAKPIDIPLDGPVWEGNLYGPTFAALPLAAGASFQLPTYQYDKGLGAFTVRVTGSETVPTPAGPVEAWVLDAGSNPEQRLEYLIAKADGRELGYRSPRGGQALGGDCTGVE